MLSYLINEIKLRMDISKLKKLGFILISFRKTYFFDMFSYFDYMNLNYYEIVFSVDGKEYVIKKSRDDGYRLFRGRNKLIFKAEHFFEVLIFLELNYYVLDFVGNEFLKLK